MGGPRCFQSDESQESQGVVSDPYLQVFFNNATAEYMDSSTDIDSDDDHEPDEDADSSDSDISARAVTQPVKSQAQQQLPSGQPMEFVRIPLELSSDQGNSHGLNSYLSG